MNRLLSTILHDIRLQYRNGLYLIGLMVALFIIAFGNYFFDKEMIAYLIPFLFLSSLLATAFYFLAGLILLEKREGTLEGLVVSPVKPWEYITSKIITLALLAMLESLLVVLFTYGPGLRWLPLITGITFMSVFYSLYAFILITRYDSITDFLIPSAFYTLAIQLPFLHYFGIWDSPIFYLWPTQAQMLLMKSAFEPLDPWTMVYASIYSIPWIVLFYLGAQKAFHRFIIRKEGNR